MGIVLIRKIISLGWWVLNFTCWYTCRCCDGKRCRNTFHLGCLDPPLLEVPTSKFFCPSCSQKRSVVKAQGEKHNEQTTHSTEHQNHILRYVLVALKVMTLVLSLVFSMSYVLCKQAHLGMANKTI